MLKLNHAELDFDSFYILVNKDRIHCFERFENSNALLTIPIEFKLSTKTTEKKEFNCYANFVQGVQRCVTKCDRWLECDMAARAGVEPTTLRMKVIDSTKAPSRPTILHEIYTTKMEAYQKYSKITCSV